jgi:hypothetical protein
MLKELSKKPKHMDEEGPKGPESNEEVNKLILCAHALGVRLIMNTE